MLPKINHKILFILLKIKETWNTLLCFVLMVNSTEANLKQIAEIKTPHPNCGNTYYLIFITASMLPEIFTRYFSIYGISRKNYKIHCSVLLWWSSTQAHLQQIAEMKTSHVNCGETAFYNFIIVSMLPEIFHNRQSLIYGKSRKHHERHCFLLFWWSSI